MRNENVVEFPTGRSMSRPTRGRKTVALLARKLVAGARLLRLEQKCRPLPIELRDLTGVADQTVDVLTALARSRVLTPASAARLAMRHAIEIGRFPSRIAGACETCRRCHRLMLAGDVFGRSAFRIEDPTGDAWVARGTSAGLDLLFEVCPGGSGSFYLLLTPDPEAPPTIDLRKPRNWRADLARLAHGSERSVERQILVVGGLPRSNRHRVAIIAGIEDALLRGGMGFRVDHSSHSVGIATACERALQARRHLSLIQIAFPGLVALHGGTR